MKQIYENSEAFDMGKTTIEYKELIISYRKIINEMDITAVTEYAYELPKTNMVMEAIRLEVL